MEKLKIRLMNRIDALNEEKHYSLVELIDKETGQLLGYIYEKDLINYWNAKKKTVTKEKESHY